MNQRRRHSIFLPRIKDWPDSLYITNGKTWVLVDVSWEITHGSGVQTTDAIQPRHQAAIQSGSNFQENILIYPFERGTDCQGLLERTVTVISLPSGAASLNAKMNGMIALRTVALFLATSLVSALIGLVLVILVHPGDTQMKVGKV